MTYNEELLNKIHDRQFNMLCKFDEVCKAHDISYFLDGGTLLGALRHNDFIPWDDDVDICLKREDFDRLLSYKNEFYPYRLFTPDKDDGFFWDFTTRLVDDNVLFKKDSAENDFYRHNNCQCAFIDLFVFDNHPDGIRGTIQLGELMFLYIMAISRRYRKKYEKPNNIIYSFIIDFIILFGSFFSYDSILKMYDKVSRNFNNLKCDNYLVSNVTIARLKISRTKQKWYEENDHLYIRDKKFPVPFMYKEALERLYGDYIKIPPEEYRTPTHISDYDDVVFK